jgi:methylated-DNA-[protein]-cysteine S-methyltransferase
MSTRQADRSAPTPDRQAGAGRRPVTALYRTAWGDGVVTVCDGRLIAVDVPGDGAEGLVPPQTGEVHSDDQTALHRWIGELEAYFRGERLSWTAEEVGPERLGVPEFAQKVYATLLTVPAAETVSYGGLAELAGYPRAARAVGSAMANNPIPIVVPCHRVIRSDGSYGNYGNDPAYKGRLLEHERAHVARGGGGT